MPPSERVQIEIRERLFVTDDDDHVGWEVVRYAANAREVLAEGTTRTHDSAWTTARDAFTALGLGLEVDPCR